MPHATSVETLPPIGTSTGAMEEIASPADPDQQFKPRVLVIWEMKQPIFKLPIILTTLLKALFQSTF